MAKVHIADEQLVVDIEGLFDKLMALSSSLKIPVKHVRGVRAHPKELMDDTWILRVFGASLSKTHIGYFWKKGDGLVFCDIHNMEDVIVIDLAEERLKHLYVQVTDETPEAAVERLLAALGPLPTLPSDPKGSPLPSNLVGLG